MPLSTLYLQELRAWHKFYLLLGTRTLCTTTLEARAATIPEME